MVDFLEIRALSKTFKTPAIADLNLTVAAGQLVAIHGPNGSGKSTLLRLIAGLLAPTSGNLQIDGCAPALYRRRQPIGLLLEGERTFYWRLSVADNLRFFATIYGLKPAEADRRIAALPSTWHLETLLSRRFESLSAGMRRRVALARALLHEPRLVLLDDPQSLLDSDGMTLLKEALQRCRANGQTVLFTAPTNDDNANLLAMADIQLPMSGIHPA